MKTLFTVEHRDGQHPLVGFTDSEGYVLPPRACSSIEFGHGDKFAVRGVEKVSSDDGACSCGISIVEHPIDTHTRIREMIETAARAFEFSEMSGGEDDGEMKKLGRDLIAEARRLSGIESAA